MNMKVLTPSEIHAKGSAMKEIYSSFDEMINGAHFGGLVRVPEDGEYPETRGVILHYPDKVNEEIHVYPGYDDEGNPGRIDLEIRGKDIEFLRKGTVDNTGYLQFDGACFPFIGTLGASPGIILPRRSSDGGPGVLRAIRYRLDTEEILQEEMLCQVR